MYDGKSGNTEKHLKGYEDDFYDRESPEEGYHIDKNPFVLQDRMSKNWKNIHKRKAVRGCVDVLLNLVGTRFDKTKEFVHKYKEDGILWYLESFLSTVIL